jgi:hypothetical protein
MSIADENFRREYKPLHIPAHYSPGDSEQDKVLYGLAQIGEGTAEDVGIEVAKADTSIEPEGFTNLATPVLKQLFDKGLIKGRELNGTMHYNLSKITQANNGYVNPGSIK